MFDNARMLDLIERTLDADPVCPVCGAPTDVREHDGRLWIECSSAPTDEPSGLIARLEAALRAHPRRLIVDLGEGLAA
jgi:ssDNA-binding Zn-finger/Zn-ribbon topoisomerase 1